MMGAQPRAERLAAGLSYRWSTVARNARQSPSAGRRATAMGECARGVKDAVAGEKPGVLVRTWGGGQKDAHLAQAGDTSLLRNLLQGAGWGELHCMTSQTHNT